MLTGSRLNPRILHEYGDFSLFFIILRLKSLQSEPSRFCYPSKYPLHVFDRVLNESLHPVRTRPVHLLCDMGVDVQCGGCIGMAEVALYGLDIITRTNSSYGIRMPLRYNNDKRKKP